MFLRNVIPFNGCLESENSPGGCCQNSSVFVEKLFQFLSFWSIWEIFRGFQSDNSTSHREWSYFNPFGIRCSLASLTNLLLLVLVSFSFLISPSCLFWVQFVGKNREKKRERIRLRDVRETRSTTNDEMRKMEGRNDGNKKQFSLSSFLQPTTLWVFSFFHIFLSFYQRSSLVFFPFLRMTASATSLSFFLSIHYSSYKDTSTLSIFLFPTWVSCRGLLQDTSRRIFFVAESESPPSLSRVKPYLTFRRNRTKVLTIVTLVLTSLTQPFPSISFPFPGSKNMPSCGYLSL